MERTWPTAALIVLVAVLLAPRTAEGAETCRPTEALPDQIRPIGCELAGAIAAGLERSPTFRRVIERVGELKGIIYIEPRHFVQSGTRRVLSGALMQTVTVAGAYRILHILVAPESGDRPVLTLAHELQHAIEVLESDAKSEAEVNRLFARIGASTGAWIVETQPALEVEHAVGRELTVNRSKNAMPD